MTIGDFCVMVGVTVVLLMVLAVICFLFWLTYIMLHIFTGFTFL